jgi:hypothetical protein
MPQRSEAVEVTLFALAMAAAVGVLWIVAGALGGPAALLSISGWFAPAAGVVVVLSLARWRREVRR